MSETSLLYFQRGKKSQKKCETFGPLVETDKLPSFLKYVFIVLVYLKQDPNLTVRFFPSFIEISSVQLLSHVWLFATPWTTARWASPSITNSWSPPKLMTIELMMSSNHLILCHPLLLLPSIFPSIRVFSDESALRIGWPKYWSFSFNINPSNEHLGLISFRMDWFKFGKGACQGCILSPCLFNFYAEYIMWNAGLDESQIEIKTARRNINNLS